MGKPQYILKKKSRDPSYKLKEGNLPAKKYKKGTPVVSRLSFEFEGLSTRFIDVAAALSVINRKAYRQSCYYYVNSIELYDSADNVVNILTVPDTWITRAAYRRAKGIYESQIEKAMDTVGSNVLGKYHEFRVYMTDLHRQNGTTFPFLHTVNDGIPSGVTRNGGIVPNEWRYSEFVSMDVNNGSAPADEFVSHMVGPTTDNGASPPLINSAGIIESYAKTRRTVQTSDTSSGNIDVADPLLNVFDASPEEAMNDIVTNLKDYGDAPYVTGIYTGENIAHLQHVARLATTSDVGRVVQEEGFCAPLGLICVDPLNISGLENNQFRIVLNLAVGTYHGIYAERMD